MIAYFATDLVWATRLKGAAEYLGIAARPTRSVEMLEARLADSKLTGLIVDLADPETALALVRRVRQHAPAEGSPERITVAAFGPHVERELFEAARNEGVDLLLTRGQLHASMADVLQRLAGQ